MLATAMNVVFLDLLYFKRLYQHTKTPLVLSLEEVVGTRNIKCFGTIYKYIYSYSLCHVTWLQGRWSKLNSPKQSALHILTSTNFRIFPSRIISLRSITVHKVLGNSNFYEYVITHRCLYPPPICIFWQLKPPNIPIFPPVATSPVLCLGLPLLLPLPTNFNNLPLFNTDLNIIPNSCFNI